jgi:ubiquinone/menaquinone biosynthesis C-methylase UbiE
LSAGKLRTFAQRFLLAAWSPTDRQAWDFYARAHRFDRRAGDEWNRPDLLGVPVTHDQLIQYLDRAVFEPYVKQLDPDVLLEIGPGGGRVTEILIAKCRKLIAADISPLMLRNLKLRFQNESSIEFHELDGHGLSGIPDDSVDAVVSYDVFVHLTPWDIFHYLREIRRVLRAGGGAIIHHANTLSELGWENFMAEVPRQVGRQKMPQTFTPMTVAVMERFAEKAGLEVVECLTTVVPRDAISILRAW